MTTHEQIDRIIRFDGGGLPVVSLFVRVEPDGSPHTGRDVQTRVNSMLDPVRALEKDRAVDGGRAGRCAATWTASPGPRPTRAGSRA